MTKVLSSSPSTPLLHGLIKTFIRMHSPVREPFQKSPQVQNPMLLFSFCGQPKELTHYPL